MNTIPGSIDVPVYRCVYCKRRLNDRTQIPSHDMLCPLKRPMMILWNRQMAKHQKFLRSIGIEVTHQG